jgi:hypothetical protein
MEVMLKIIWIVTCKFTQYFLLRYLYFTVMWTVEFLPKKTYELQIFPQFFIPIKIILCFIPVLQHLG